MAHETHETVGYPDVSELVYVFVQVLLNFHDQLRSLLDYRRFNFTSELPENMKDLKRFIGHPITAPLLNDTKVNAKPKYKAGYTLQ